ncbi:MAG: acyltransferase [Chitinophagaceae bacterium]|nr:acyltransferase [Chitinophagaceae bacterium]
MYRTLRYDWPLHFVLMLTNWWPDNVVLMRWRGALCRPFLKRAGRNLRLGRGITFYNPSKISIGSDVYIARGCWFSAGEEIHIGNKILFGPYVVVVTGNHSILNDTYHDGPPVDRKPVVISDGCWIGAHATILSGTTLGPTSLLAANSVLSRDTEPRSIYGGVPAKFIRNAE